MSEVNDNGFELKDISHELYRTYVFSEGDPVVINQPTGIHVTYAGHRIETADGECHFVARGWKEIKWRVKPGAPSFVM